MTRLTEMSSTGAESEPAPTLSLCMIVRNEEQTLARCLRSVIGVVDQMVVVDTGSTDKTPAIAQEFGALVVHSPWQHDFSQARNVALSHATGRWVLCLDADEMLLDGDGARLREFLVKRTPAADEYPTTAYNLIVRSGAAGAKTGGSAYIIRLFPNRPDVRFEWRVHEQVATSLMRAGIPVENLPVTILHTGYSDLETNKRKQARNRELLRQQIKANENISAMTFFLLAGCYLDLDDPAAAIAHYEQCRKMAAVGTDIHRGATVRVITCLLALGRHQEALAQMPGPVDSAWHPETVLDRATVASVVESADAARCYYETVLACADAPQIPVCNVISLKIEALKALGNYWHARGRGALAVQLLRRAVALSRDGSDFTSRDLQELYKTNP